MGIGNMINRLLNNESKDEKDERLDISKEKENVEVSNQATVEETVDEVIAKDNSSNAC